MGTVRLKAIRDAIALAQEMGVAEMRVDGLGLTVKLAPKPARTEVHPEQVRVTNCGCGCPPWNHANGICKDHGPDPRCRTKATR